jgi:hypothetical protein
MPQIIVEEKFENVDIRSSLSPKNFCRFVVIFVCFFISIMGCRAGKYLNSSENSRLTNESDSPLIIKSPALSRDFFGQSWDIDRGVLAVSDIIWNTEVKVLGSGKVFFYDSDTTAEAFGKRLMEIPAPGLARQFGSSLAYKGDLLAALDKRGYFYNADTGEEDRSEARVVLTIFKITLEAGGFELLKSTTLSLQKGFQYDDHIEFYNDFLLIGSFSPTQKSETKGGAVHFVDIKMGSGTFGEIVFSIHNPHPQEADHFGYSLWPMDKHLFVSAPGDDTMDVNSGAVYMYKINWDNIRGTKLIKAFYEPDPSPKNGEYVGWRIAATSKVLLVSAPLEDREDDEIGIREGVVYIFNADPEDESFGNYIDALDNKYPITSGGRFGFLLTATNNKAFIAQGPPAPNQKLNGEIFSINVDPDSENFRGMLQRYPLPKPDGFRQYGFPNEKLLYLDGSLATAGIFVRGNDNLVEHGSIMFFRE